MRVLLVQLDMNATKRDWQLEECLDSRKFEIPEHVNSVAVVVIQT